MRNLALILSMLLTSCGIEEVNVNGPETVNVDEEGGVSAGKSTSEETSEETTTTTTTTTTTKKSETVTSYHIVNENASNEEFVSSNYCGGYSSSDCWIRSAILIEKSDGTYKVSIEFWDTRDAKPYSVEKDVIEDSRSFMITDGALMDGDYGTTKMLWAVVDPENKTMTIVYDWDNDGPNGQGDDIIETLSFTLEE